MRKFLLPLLMLIFLFSAIDSAQAVDKEEIKKKLMSDHMLGNNSMGTEFYIAFPPNEMQNYGVGPMVLEIYVASSYSGHVTISNPQTGLNVTKEMTKFTITTFSNTNEGDGVGFHLEMRASERVTQNGVKIESDVPISVYVLTGKKYTSEGYLAIPVSQWGTEYIHNSYYEFDENSSSRNDWKTGFIVIAAYDNTMVNIQLRGRDMAHPDAHTIKGRRIGDVIPGIQLNAGETYQVSSAGKTRGIFDLSGSLITASKPVGVISYHERTIIPSFNINNGRDCLSEMMPPTHSWGKEYYTVEYKRDSGLGDFYRVVALQGNTTVRCEYYDLIDGNVIGNWNFTLKNPGEFNEALEIMATYGDQNGPSIRGMVKITADKPIMAFQYSYSEQWDGAEVFDPFMILLTPMEQYIPSTVFQTPSNKTFENNYFNIIAVGDTADPNSEKLKAITLDEEPIYIDNPQFLSNNIPGTNLFWSKIQMQAGAHTVETGGKTVFGGYIYGFAHWDSYGWPAAIAFKKLDETDTLPPEVEFYGECGDYEFTFTEIRNGAEGDDPRQLDQGVSTRPRLLEDSYNFNNPVFPTPWKPFPPVKEDGKFSLSVTDKYQDAYALIPIIDQADNVTVNEIWYEADSLLLDPEIVEFHNVRVGTTKQLIVKLQSASDSIITVTDIKLKNNSVFQLVDGPAPEFDLEPREEIELTFEYTPDKEIVNPEDFNEDSLIVTTSCLTWAWQLKGRGVIPCIDVEPEWNAGLVRVDETKEMRDEASGNRGLLIYNRGTDTLKITGYSFSPDADPTPFVIKNQNLSFPLSILPGEYRYLTEIWFEPTTTGTFETFITFESNSDEDGNRCNNVSHWYGSSNEPGPYITDYNWERRRVGTENDAQVFIRNSGSGPVRITGVNLDAASPYIGEFEIISTEPAVSSANPAVLYPEDNPNELNEIKVNCRFSPTVEFDKDIQITVQTHPEDMVPEGSVFNTLRGYGYLPKIEVEGYEWVQPWKINTLHDDIGTVTITSTSESADLFVQEIKKVGTNPNEFDFVDPLPTNFTIKTGEPLELEVRFTPGEIGDRTALIEVVNDANEAPDSIITTTTNLLGHGIDEGLAIEGHNFGAHMRCDDATGTITILNTGRTNEITISSLELTAGDVAVFEIGDLPGNTIQPQASMEVPVTFHPIASTDYRTFEADVTVETDQGMQATAKLEAESLTEHIIFTIDDLPDNYPGMPIMIPININNPGFEMANVTEFSLVLKYKTDWMAYENALDMGDALVGNWNISAVEDNLSDPGWTRLVISGQSQGNSFLSGTGIVANPHFKLMLPEDVKTFTVELININVADRAPCVTTEGDDCSITLDYCVEDLRNVIISQDNFSLAEITPNPVTKSEVNLDYSVGFKVDTRIELINSNGELVKVLLDEEKDHGNYKLPISTQELSSGVYHIKMVSGPYSTTKSMIIVK